MNLCYWIRQKSCKDFLCCSSTKCINNFKELCKIFCCCSFCNHLTVFRNFIYLNKFIEEFQKQTEAETGVAKDVHKIRLFVSINQEEKASKCKKCNCFCSR